MKAARLVERRKPLELTDLPDPAPGPGEVVVEVEAEGIRNADFNCIKLPDSIDGLSAAAIGCRYMTAFHAVTRQGRLPLEQASAVLDAMDSYETLGFSVITGF